MKGQRLALCFVVPPSLRNCATIRPCVRIQRAPSFLFRQQHTDLCVHDASNVDELPFVRPLNHHAPSFITHSILLSLLRWVLPCLFTLGAWTVLLPSHNVAFAYPATAQEIPPPITGMACVARKCSTELKECLSDSTCSKGLTCFVKCAIGNQQGAEGICQERCMDVYESPRLDRFTECTITDNKCYPALPADSRYPAFQAVDRLTLGQTDLLESPSKLQELLLGRWYIAAGLNPAFDCFDCQVHDFYRPATSVNDDCDEIILADATFSYRIRLEDDTWRTKTGEKRLMLETKYAENTVPSNLQFDLNKRWGIDSFVTSKTSGGNANKQTAQQRRLILTLRPSRMNYRDEWMILAAEPNRFFIVAYSGTNAAWEGYGGLNVYTRSGTLEDDLLPEIEKGLSKVGLSLQDLTLIDNSCQSRR